MILTILRTRIRLSTLMPHTPLCPLTLGWQRSRQIPDDKYVVQTTLGSKECHSMADLCAVQTKTKTAVWTRCNKCNQPVMCRNHSDWTDLFHISCVITLLSFYFFVDFLFSSIWLTKLATRPFWRTISIMYRIVHCVSEKNIHCNTIIISNTNATRTIYECFLTATATIIYLCSKLRCTMMSEWVSK